MQHGRETENDTIDALLETIRQEDGDTAPAEEAFPELPSKADGAEGAGEPLRDDVLHGVKLRVKVELGRTRMALKRALDLSCGSIVELDKTPGETVEILVNSIPIARGRVLVVDGRFCVRIEEIITTLDAASSC